MTPAERLAVRERIAAKAWRPAMRRHSAKHMAMMRRELARQREEARKKAERRDCPMWAECFDAAARANERVVGCARCKVTT